MIYADNYDDYLTRPYDRPDESGIIGECDVCGRAIYRDDPHYNINSVLVCGEWSCLHDHIDGLGYYVS